MTIRNEVDLNLGYSHLMNSFKRIMQLRREALSARNTGSKKHTYAISSSLSTVIGGGYSVEVKRGKNQNLWHPHINLLALTEKPINYKKIQKEWNNYTGNQSNLHLTLLTQKDEYKHFLEIFKYALKFSDLEFEDNLTAILALKKKRLLGTFGQFRGLKLNEKEEFILNPITIKDYYFDGVEYIESVFTN